MPTVDFIVNIKTRGVEAAKRAMQTVGDVANRTAGMIGASAVKVYGGQTAAVIANWTEVAQKISQKVQSLPGIGGFAQKIAEAFPMPGTELLDEFKTNFLTGLEDFLNENLKGSGFGRGVALLRRQILRNVGGADVSDILTGKTLESLKGLRLMNEKAFGVLSKGWGQLLDSTGGKLMSVSRKLTRFQGSMMGMSRILGLVGWKIGIIGFVGIMVFKQLLGWGKKLFQMSLQFINTIVNIDKTLTTLAISAEFFTQMGGKGRKAGADMKNGMQEAIGAFKQAFFAMTAFSGVITLLYLRIGVRLLPAFERFVVAMAAILDNQMLINNVVAFFTQILNGVLIVLPAIVTLLNMWLPLLTMLLPIISQILAFITPMIPMLMAMFAVLMVLGPVIQTVAFATMFLGLNLAPVLAILIALGPILLVVIAAVAAAVAIWYAWNTNLWGFRDAVLAAWDALVAFWDAIVGVVEILAGGIWGLMTGDWSFMEDGFRRFGELVGAAWAQGFLEMVKNVFSNPPKEDYEEYLAGHSPPKKGPLSHVDEWGRAVGEAYGQSLSLGIQTSLDNSEFGIGTSGEGGYGGASGPININIYMDAKFDSYEDIEPIVDELARRLGEKLRGGGVI